MMGMGCLGSFLRWNRREQGLIVKRLLVLDELGGSHSNITVGVFLDHVNCIRASHS